MPMPLSFLSLSGRGTLTGPTHYFWSTGYLDCILVYWRRRLPRRVLDRIRWECESRVLSSFWRCLTSILLREATSAPLLFPLTLSLVDPFFFFSFYLSVGIHLFPHFVYGAGMGFGIFLAGIFRYIKLMTWKLGHIEQHVLLGSYFGLYEVGVDVFVYFGGYLVRSDIALGFEYSMGLIAQRACSHMARELCKSSHRF